MSDTNSNGDTTHSAALALTVQCHGAAFNAGWWVNPETGEQRNTNLSTREGLLEFAACGMNIHAEISEAWEGVRKGNKPSDHIPEFSFAEEEIADTIIRLFDVAGAFKLRVSEAVVAKMAYNLQRADHKIENRQADGGKRV